MAHLHTIMDDDLYFSIDPFSKTVTYLGEEPLVIAQTDHNSEQFTFEIPRYIEGHDMLLCDKVEVHYINIGTVSSIRNPGIYKVKDLAVAEDDNETLTFSWTISSNATRYVGSLNYAIRFACTTGSKIDYSWNTLPFSGITIGESYDNSHAVIDQYADVLEEWYMELIMSGTVGVNIVLDAKNEALEELSGATSESLATIDEKTVESVMKLQSGELIVELTQDTIDNIVNTGNEAVENVQNKHDESLETIRSVGNNITNMIDDEFNHQKTTIVSEVLLRVNLGGSAHYISAEGVSF